MGKDFFTTEENEFFDQVEEEHLAHVAEAMRNAGYSNEEIKKMFEESKEDSR